jgi:hypothetical protein
VCARCAAEHWDENSWAKGHAQPFSTATTQLGMQRCTSPRHLESPRRTMGCSSARTILQPSSITMRNGNTRSSWSPLNTSARAPRGGSARYCCEPVEHAAFVVNEKNRSHVGHMIAPGSGWPPTAISSSRPGPLTPPPVGATPHNIIVGSSPRVAATVTPLARPPTDRRQGDRWRME